MNTNDNDRLQAIKDFSELVGYLRDELDWPIKDADFDDLTFDYEPQELGIDAKTAAKIEHIKQLRKLEERQPWGIFFIEFEPKRLPVVALRRILNRVVVKKRDSANSPDRATWAMHDLLFISNFGEGDTRQICFAHFTEDKAVGNLASLNVLGWDGLDTGLHIANVVSKLKQHLCWPKNIEDMKRWGEAFVTRHRYAITTSKELAVRLADLAKGIRQKVMQAFEIETEKGPLRQLMKSFKDSLIHDLKEADFADMYAQTIAYGLLAARVSRQSGALVADNAADMVPMTSPFLREMMETFLNLGGRKKSEKGPMLDFDELGINDVVETLREANMGAVLQDFGDRNPQEDPVIHFYELFLKEYDAKKRMQRGVFYTPRPVVSYIVRSVHELLQTEFGLADGLADTTTWGEMAQRNPDIKIPVGVSSNQDFVQILDPATGTGTFLVEVIGIVHNTLEKKWKDQGMTPAQIDEHWNEYVPKHLLPRLHGFELLMAPYAIAHMKIGLKLSETGYRFGSDERVRIYLTNALEPALDFTGTIYFAVPALAHEAKAVNLVKETQRFTVVIGNPPWSKMSGNRSQNAIQKIEPFRYISGKKIVLKGSLAHEINMQDDYVKFYGLMTELIISSGYGIGTFISNSGYINSLSLEGLRHYFMKEFSHVCICDLGGRVADRNCDIVDENVFDIEQGNAICSITRTPSGNINSLINYGRLHGTRIEKYNKLIENDILTICSTEIQPSLPHYRFMPISDVSDSVFNNGMPIDDLFSVNSGGIITSRDNLCISMDSDSLLKKVMNFAYSPIGDTVVFEEIGFTAKKKWDVEKCKKDLLNKGIDENYIERILYRPFDVRYIYYNTNLIDTPSRPVSEMAFDGSNLILLSPLIKTTDDFSHALVSRYPAEKKSCSHDRATQMFPLLITDSGLFGDSAELNIPEKVKGKFLKNLTIPADNMHELGLCIISYCYSILYSPSYRRRYGKLLRNSFPKVPLDTNPILTEELIEIGKQLISLHLLEYKYEPSKKFQFIGLNTTVSRIGWTSDNDGTVWIDGKGSKGQFKPGTSGFSPVPKEVWDFYVGGYQVCEKWLKDRKGRTLTDEDITHYNKIVIALSETIRLMAEIDEVIEKHGGWPGAFTGKDS